MVSVRSRTNAFSIELVCAFIVVLNDVICLVVPSLLTWFHPVRRQAKCDSAITVNRRPGKTMANDSMTEVVIFIFSTREAQFFEDFFSSIQGTL